MSCASGLINFFLKYLLSGKVRHDDGLKKETDFLTTDKSEAACKNWLCFKEIKGDLTD